MRAVGDDWVDDLHVYNCARGKQILTRATLYGGFQPTDCDDNAAFWMSRVNELRDETIDCESANLKEPENLPGRR